MNPFRQILSDTAALSRDLQRGWKHVSWRLSWWRRKREISSEKLEAETENLKRSITATTKMCRECRALIPGSAGKCPECGATTSHIRSGGVGRAVSRLLPFELTVTSGLISAYFVLFLTGLFLSIRLPAPPGYDVQTPFQALMSLDFRALVMTGANFGPLSGGREPWRLLTATFLHRGILHLVFNTWAMMAVGPMIEQLYGPRKMFVLTLATGVGGNILSLWWHGPALRQVGASGAIFGLIGVAAVYGFRRGDALGQSLKRHMMEWAVYGLVMGLLMRADNAAHLGGFIAGAAAAFIVGDADRVSRPASDRMWSALAYLALLASAASFVLIAKRWAGAA